MSVPLFFFNRLKNRSIMYRSRIKKLRGNKIQMSKNAKKNFDIIRLSFKSYIFSFKDRFKKILKNSERAYLKV